MAAVLGKVGAGKTAAKFHAGTDSFVNPATASALRCVDRCGREGGFRLHRLQAPVSAGASMVKFEQRFAHMMKATYAAPVSSADPRMLVDRIADGRADQRESASICDAFLMVDHPAFSPAYNAYADRFL